MAGAVWMWVGQFGCGRSKIRAARLSYRQTATKMLIFVKYCNYNIGKTLINVAWMKRCP